MYETHFGFNSRPFSATPDGGCFYPTENTGKAFESIVSCIQRASGAALIVGGSGLGKSTLLLAIAKHFQQEYSVAFLESASLESRKELLQNILFELGLPFHGMEEGELRLTLMDYLKPGERCRNGLLLCVDEAHLLSAKLLEEMRLITNLVRDGQPRARLVLAGNSSIEDRLAEPQLDSLSQRISTRAYLSAMNTTETRKYISDCLAAVGKSLEEVFEEDAIEAVFVATHGVPRLVNQVCDHALILAIGDGQNRITSRLINEAWSDIQRLPVDWNVLGNQSTTQTESVIEFGSLDDHQDSTTNLTDADSGHSIEQSTSPAQSDNDSVEFEFESSESAISEKDATSQGDDQGPFKFKGPRNPFAEEFTEEERVADKFSQMIGHSPTRPNYPTAENRPPVAKVSDENEAEPVLQNEPTPIESNESETDSITGFDAAGQNQAIELGQSNIEKDEPQEALESIDSEKPPAEQTLDEYLANTKEAITFGVGQGIYADQFKSLEVEQQLDVSDAGTNPDADANAVGEELDQTESQPIESTQSTPENPIETQTENKSSIKVARIDLSTTTEFGELPAGHEPTTEPLDDKTVDRATIEQEITRAVSDLKTGVENAVLSESAVSNEETQNQNIDDRDMIVVENKSESQDDEPAEGVDTVPMREPETQSTPQVKREDYKQLFDRLRNG